MTTRKILPMRRTRERSSKKKKSKAKKGKYRHKYDSSDSSDYDEEEEEEYEVEEILDKKIKKGIALYLVKWKGFSLEDTTWEPATNLENAPLKIKNFENQLLAKEKEKDTK